MKVTISVSRTKPCLSGIISWLQFSCVPKLQCIMLRLLCETM